MKSIILYVLIDRTIICFLWRLEIQNNQEWKSWWFRSLWERKKKKVEISPSRNECQSETREEVNEGWKLEGRQFVYDLAAWGLWVYTAEAAGWCSPLGRVQIKQRVKQKKWEKQTNMAWAADGPTRWHLSTQHKSSFITLILALCLTWHSYRGTLCHAVESKVLTEDLCFSSIYWAPFWHSD